MDRNSLIGMLLLFLLGGGYIFYSNHQSEQYNEYKRSLQQDSIAKAQEAAALLASQAPEIDSATLDDSTVAIFNPYKGKSEIITISNGLISLGVNTKGGTPKLAKLDTFKTYLKGDLNFFDDEENKFNIALPTATGSINSGDLYYIPTQETLADGSTSLVMTSDLGNGQKIAFEYIIKPNSYQIKSNIKLLGFQNEIAKAGATLPLQWIAKTARTEKDVENERMALQAHFYEMGEGHDYYTFKSSANKNIELPVKWYGLRSQFFHTSIVADQQFTNASYNAEILGNTIDTHYVGRVTTTLQIPTVASNDFNFGYSIIISPNDYKLLKSFGNDMEGMIHLGLGPFTFVKYISKLIIIPMFDFFNSFLSNGGIIIILMTIVIRLFLSFFSYKSFLSQAKMRVLKPELDALRAKYGDDQQQMGMEQMKLYRTAGVNPMGGCLPMLLQMPFLLSIYYWVPTELSFRQQKFLWADDLSSYDSILDLGFRIPMYGDHISLFTLLMATTTILITLYNRNNTAAAGGDMANNPAIKYMPYIMPIMFLGWFNTMAAALTFYYTCSNLISILQQFIIQKAFIDEKKILQKIEANKLNPKKNTNKWQERLEQMQKMQQERMKQK
jgi:YidC/Oxa1 family membrane protein insertase